MRTALLHRLAFGIWAMEPTRAQAYYGVVASLLSGERIEVGEKRTLQATTWCAHENGTVVKLGAEQQPTEGMVLQLQLNDVVLKRSDECTFGVDQLVESLQAADADPNVEGVVLSIDSPGGEGSAMNWAADVLAGMKKPVVAHIGHGMAASAAYGIAASCTEVLASSELDQFGSIGTYVTLMDRKAFFKAKGIPVHEVYATLSTEKNGPAREALLASGDDPEDKHYKKLRTEYIDPFNHGFINLVQKRRPQMADTTDAWMNGQLMYAKDAKEAGLIDGYASVPQAVQRVKALAAARRTAPSTKQATTTTMKFADLFTKALTMLGLSDDKTKATAEELTAANAELSATGLQLITTEEAAELATIADLKAKAAKADSLEAELLAEQNAAKAENEKLNAALEKYGIKLGDKQNNVDAILATLDQWAGNAGATHTGGQKKEDKKSEPELAGHAEALDAVATLPGAKA